MKQLISIFCLQCVVCLSGVSQTTIKVLGRQAYTTEADSYLIEFNKGLKANKEERLLSFKRSLDSLSVDYKELDVYYEMMSIQIADGADLETATRIYDELNLAGKRYYYYSDKDLKDQDQMAIKALEDAQRRADKIATAIGKRVHRILTIDDDVESYLFYTDLNVSSQCHKDMANLLIEFFKNRIPLTEIRKSDESQRNSMYALWVEFEVK